MFGFSRTNSHEHLDQMFDYLLHIFMTKQAMCRSRNERIKGLFFLPFTLLYIASNEYIHIQRKRRSKSGISFLAMPVRKRKKKHYQRKIVFFLFFQVFGKKYIRIGKSRLLLTTKYLVLLCGLWKKMKRAMGAARGNSPARSLFSVDCPNRHLNAHSLANIPYIVRSPYIGSTYAR